LSAPLVSIRRYVTSIKDGTHGTHERVPDGIPLLSAKNIQDGAIVMGLEESRITPDEYWGIHRSGYLAAGDVLLTIVGTIGRTAVYDGQAMVAFQRSVASLRPASHCHGRFLFYCLSSTLVQEQLSAAAHQSAQSGVYLGDVAMIEVPLLPLATQRAIADYLDRRTARIDALIAAKRRMVELFDERLEARREDLIWTQHGVELRRALRRACALIKDGTHQPPQRVESGYPLLSVRNLDNGCLSLRDDDSMVTEADYIQLTKSWKIEPGDVALAIVGATLGKVGMVGDLPPVAIQRSVAILRPRSSMAISRFLYHAIATRSFQAVLWSNVAFSAQPGVYLGAVAALEIPLPPLEDQRGTAAELDSAEERTAQLASAETRQVALLQERRQALITAAVTGQLEIPDAA
jgi:type I restriction enzyme S subunit